MRFRFPTIVLCIGIFGGAIWISTHRAEDGKAASGWKQVAPGIFRSPGMPAGYRLADAFLAGDVEP